ncbi:polysaccharide deacetylase family protein [Candidatus Saccharibacteria bacterium]|nr:polysaccharide deacetylase family protein [Candidatus Saccharibacteria bacterium]
MRRFNVSRIVLMAVTVITALCCGLFFVAGVIMDNSFVFHSVPDETPPTITVNGDIVSVVVGGKYEDSGVEAYDDRTEVTITTEGTVDTNTIGEYVLKYIATDEHGNSSEATRTVKVIQPRGIIYLTFDDGPGEYTATLLDVLKKYNVKATFFVTGHGSDDLIVREYNEGHTVALHTFSHNYAAIYQSVDAFLSDLYSVQNRVKNLTGQTVTLMRFPGGSSNTVSALYDGGTRIMSRLVDEVTARGFTYFDWNVSSGDAGGAVNSDEVFARTVTQLKDGGASIVLQHDIKDFSVAAVERIIQHCLANGYVFDKLDANSFAAHHGVNN